jgi:hypothetical protein
MSSDFVLIQGAWKLLDKRAKQSLNLACSTFYVVWAISAKFGLHADNMQFNTHNKDWTTMCIIYIFCISCAIKKTIEYIGKNNTNIYNLLHRLERLYCIFLQNKLVFNMSHNQTAHRFSHCFSFLSLFCQGSITRNFFKFRIFFGQERTVLGGTFCLLNVCKGTTV